MRIEAFEAPRYSPNVNGPERRMICEWEYQGVKLTLLESKVQGQTWLDLFVSSDSSLIGSMRIALNNGIQEILAAANQRDSMLLAVIRTHNPDLESQLDKFVPVEKLELSNSTPDAVTVATKQSRRL